MFIRGFASKLFKTSPRFHAGGPPGDLGPRFSNGSVFMSKAGEVPAIPLSSKYRIPLKPGESGPVADEIVDIKAETARAKAAHVKKIADAAVDNQRLSAARCRQADRTAAYAQEALF